MAPRHSSRSRKPVTVLDMTFKTKKAVEQYLLRLLSTPELLCTDDEVHQLRAQELVARDPKIIDTGLPVERVHALASKTHGTVCLHVYLSRGRDEACQVETVSYHKVAQAVFNPDKRRARRGPNRLAEAFRATVIDQVNAFREKEARITDDGRAVWKCEACECELHSRAEAHVDHETPTFARIVNMFKYEHDEDWDALDALTGRLKEDWWAFHKGTASLRILCVPCNTKHSEAAPVASASASAAWEDE
jgi:hypothetical protein